MSWVLMLVHNTQNYWVYALHLSSGTLNDKKTRRFGNGSVSFFRSDERGTCTAGSLRVNKV
jgi:hypothetical protein